MSLFVCDICDCVENTALAGVRGYWARNADGRDGKARCSECNPEVGKWHGHFLKLKHNGSLEVINR